MRTEVTLADPAEVLVVEHDARDRRAAEVSFGAAVKAKPGMPMKALMESYPESWILWITWHAAKRQKLTGLTWQEWTERALDVVPVGDEDDGDVLPDPIGVVT